MAISYKDVRNDRQWRSSTGLRKIQFEQLVIEFKTTYETLLKKSIEERINNSTTRSTFQTYEELLFFILYSIKSGLTYDLLALSFNMDRSNAFRIQVFALRILEMTLDRLGHMPKRFYKSLNEFKKQMEKHEEILLDATEQIRQRPENQEVQKNNYSGKKKHIL